VNEPLEDEAPTSQPVWPAAPPEYGLVYAFVDANNGEPAQMVGMTIATWKYFAQQKKKLENELAVARGELAAMKRGAAPGRIILPR
jgi:hypothetical protein